MKNLACKHPPSQTMNRVVSWLACLLLLYAVAFSWQSWREEKAAKIEELMNLLELEEQALDTYFQQLENGMWMLSQDLAEVTDEINLNQAFSLVKRFKDLHPEFLNITLMREDGQILLTARTPPALNLPTLATESSFVKFREAVREAEFLNVGQPLLSLINKEWIIPFRSPVKNREGKLTHFISANLPIGILQDFWKEALFTKKSALGLMRDDGFLVSRYPVPSKLQMDEIYGKPRTGALIKYLKQEQFPKRGYIEGPSSLNGPNFLNAFQRMEHFPLTVFIARPSSEITEAWWNKVIIPYTLSAILLLGGFFVYRMTLQRERARELEGWQASEELSNSKAFLDTVVQRSPIAMWIADDKGTLIRANQALKDRLGVSDDEVVGKYNILEDNLIEEQGLMPLVRDVFEHGKTVRFTMEYDTSRVHKLALASFKQTILDITISPIRDSNGRLTNAIIQHIDISKQKEAEKALQVSERKLKESLLLQDTILENSPFGISMVIDRRQLWVNRKMEEMFQYSKGEMKDKATLDLFSSREAHDRIGREAYLLLAQGKPYESEEELTKRDGSIMQVRCCGKAVDPSDMSKGTIWSLEDITENKKIRQQLLETEEQYRRLVDNAPDILYRYSSESGGAFYSQRVESILGYSVAELYERPMIWHDSIHSDDLPRVDEAISQLPQNQRFDLQYRIQAKNGQWHWFHDRAIGILAEGNKIVIEGLARDITQQRKSEEALREAHSLLDSIIDSLPDATLVIDIEGKVISWNKAIEKMTGIVKSEILQKGDYEYALPFYGERRPILIDIALKAESEPFQGLYDRIERDGENYCGEIYVPEPYQGKGAYLWEVASALRDTSGNVIGAIESVRDISHRKQLEEKLRESEKRYRAIFERTGAIKLIIDPETGIIVDANPASSEFYGYTLEKLRSMSILDINTLPGGEVEQAMNLTRRGRRDFFFFQHRLASGEIRDVNIHSSPFEMEGRTLLFSLVVDVSDRKRMQDALEASEARFRLLVENAPDAIFVQTQGRFAYVNPATVKLLEAESKDLLIGKPVLERVHPSSVEFSRNRIQQVNTERKPVPPRELKILTLDGRILDVESNATPICYEDREGALVFLRDITERKLAEQALRESEERWKFALEGSGDGVWDWNAETNEVKYSRQWKSMLGFEDHEIGNTLAEWDQRVHPEDRSHVYEEINKHFSGQTDIYVSEHRVRCKDGSFRWILDRGKVVQWTEDGRPLRVIGTHTDLHERRKAEEERLRMEQRLHQAQKAESLGRMAGAIAHNFNNMLGAVIGNLDLAQDDVPDGSELQLFIREAQNASQRAATISRFMLTYLGQTEGKSAHVDPAAAVREACSLLSPSIPKNVHLKAEVSAQGCTIKADEAHLTQILTNLIENAIEAIGKQEGEIALSIDIVPGGEIKERKLFPLDWELRSEEYASISITDTGCGIDPEQLDNIFDPFFSTKFAGRGLGLAVVLGLLRSADGAIGVESLPGHGTSFKLFIPLAENAKPVSIKEETTVTGPVERGGLILVVDDEDTVRNMASAMLKRKLGYDVVTARDGFQALEVFSAREDEFSLVILDLSMPGMNGWQTLAALRKIRPGLPVILSSGYDEAQVCRGEHEERPHAFLPKPYGAKELKATLDAALK